MIRAFSGMKDEGLLLTDTYNQMTMAYTLSVWAVVFFCVMTVGRTQLFLVKPTGVSLYT